MLRTYGFHDRFPRLDGLRAVAILLVFWDHFFADLYGYPGTGAIGVKVFFALSGFLITRILIGYREQYTVRDAALIFYWRRFVRLAPAFYVALGLAVLLGVGGGRTAMAAHALYLTNFYVFWKGQWFASSHLWSLAVEEQFYILWFPVMMLVPLPWLGRFIVFLIAASLGYNIVASWAGLPMYSILPFGSAQYLAAGGLLGLATTDIGASVRPYVARLNMPIIGAVAFLVLAFFYNGGAALLPVPIATATSNLSTILFALSVIAQCLGTSKQSALEFLRWAPIRRAGIISYGLYIYHLFVLDLLSRFYPHHDVWLGLGSIGVTYLIAEASWRIIETPSLRAKGMVGPTTPSAVT